MAFPFFNNVDEHCHFDVIVKYASGYHPHTGDNLFEPESTTAMVRYGTPEYFAQPGQYPSNQPPSPLWKDNQPQSRQILQEIASSWTKGVNFESAAPPVYYILAGNWYNLGKLLGLSGGVLLYWLRFLNLVLYLLLMVLSWHFCQRFFPGNSTVQFGVPLLLAFFPQDVFYFLNSDILSPLSFLLAFWLMMTLLRQPPPDRRIFLLAGIAVAATVLVKLSNLPVLGIAFVFFLLIIRHLKAQTGTPGITWHAPVLFACGVLLPLLLWGGGNRYAVGDWTGTTEKTAFLGWQLKSWRELLPHPLFTAAGTRFFLAENLKTFWRGETVWFMQRLRSPLMDMVYVVTTLVFLGASMLQFIKIRPLPPARETHVIRFCGFLLIGLLLFYLAGLSLLYDFGPQCPYPSRANPYFTSGRLMLAALVPFLILYTEGLDALLRWGKVKWHPLIVLLLLGMTVTIVEVILKAPVSRSHFNLFHLYSS